MTRKRSTRKDVAEFYVPPVVRDDAYANILTGQGMRRRDPISDTFVLLDPLLDNKTVQGMLVGDGLARRIVELPAMEMVRPWFSISGDKGKEVADVLESIHAQTQFMAASIVSRLFGGAVVVLITDDVRHPDDWSKPLRPGRYNNLTGLRVFDRWRVTLHTEQLSEDPVKALDGWPSHFSVQPIRYGGAIRGPLSGAPMRIHESRIVVMPGKYLPDETRAMNNGWGASVLQGVYRALLRYATGQDNAVALLKDFTQSVLSVKGLTDMIANGREEVVRKRLELLDMSRAILNCMVIDADGEEYTKHSNSIAGLPDTIDRFAEYLSAMTGIPVMKLMGRSASGLNASGQSELQNYYDLLDTDRKLTVNPLAERVIEVIYQSAEGPTNGTEPEEWSFKWNGFYQLTDKEKADLEKAVAEKDKLYIDAGVLSGIEVAESRYGGDEWSMETKLDPSTDREALGANPFADLLGDPNGPAGLEKTGGKTPPVSEDDVYGEFYVPPRVGVYHGAR